MDMRIDTPFEDTLREELSLLEQRSLRRTLRIVESAQGPEVNLLHKPYLNFSSNDYLGLANHPRMVAASENALKYYGTGSGAARLICGNLDVHTALDCALAQFKDTEAALTYSTGYAAAVGTIPAILGRGDTVILDKLAHASLIDGARLSGARIRAFPHNNIAYLKKVLRQEKHTGRILIVTESVFSMDGDMGKLEDIVEVKEKFGAWLMVDEAHATGMYGRNRRGLVEQLGLSKKVEIQMGTLSKALGSSGGYIVGCRTLIDILINKARSFIYSTAPSPAVAAASLAAVLLIGSEEGEERRKALWDNIHYLAEKLPDRWRRPGPPESPIFPLMIGDETEALKKAQKLEKEGFIVPAIRYPTVAHQQARLRLTLSAKHEKNQIDDLVKHLAD
jgi:8-amino-7-oxononanoate synthase